MSFDDLFRKDGLTRRCSEPPTSSAIFTMLPPAGIGPAGETKDRREHEADKSSEWRGRFSEHHQAD